MDFKSPKELADKLKEISNDKNKYNSYFSWKKNVVFKNPIPLSPICSMCIHLLFENYYGIKNSMIKDLDNYWSRKNCQDPKTIPIG